MSLSQQVSSFQVWYRGQNPRVGQLMVPELVFADHRAHPEFPSEEGVRTARSLGALQRPGRRRGLWCRSTSQPLQRKAWQLCNRGPMLPAVSAYHKNAVSFMFPQWK